MVWEVRTKFTVFLGPFFVVVSFTLETVIYCEQCRVVWRSTAVTQTERLLAKCHFFQFPNPKTERKRAEIWLKNISTGCNINIFKFSKDDVVCSHHLHENCFQIDIKAKLLGYEPKRRTPKLGAFPTIFKHTKFFTLEIRTVKQLMESDLVSEPN